MEFKGTKGKWEYKYDNSDYSPHEWYNITSENHSNILKRSYYSTDLTHDQIKANALLISKAPEMLEMLKDIHSILGTSFNREKEQIKQLIKQATEL